MKNKNNFVIKTGIFLIVFILLIGVGQSAIANEDTSKTPEKNFISKITDFFKNFGINAQVAQTESIPIPFAQQYAVDMKSSEITKLPKEVQTKLSKLSKEEQANKNYELINIKQKIKETGASWTAGFTSKSILSDEEKKKLTGVIIDDKQKTKQTKSITGNMISPSDSPASLPDFFDWRNVSGQNYITSIKDQGQCGSCWAFGAVATLEGHATTYYNNPAINLELSEQDLVSCYLPNTYSQKGCDGAYDYQIQNLFSNYYVSTGISTEANFPYTAKDDACANKLLNWQQTVWKTLGYQPIDLTGDLQTRINNIKQAVMNYGPVEVGMYVYSDFPSYSGGVYSHTNENLLGGHAVTIVGFGKYDGRDYWIVKNSWGNWWGENGYFKIVAGDSKIDSWFAFAVTQPNPFISQNILCTDTDNDGYCYWGLSTTKPDSCPISCNSHLTKDCDDSISATHDGCGISTEATGTLSITSTPSDSEVYVKDLITDLWVYRGQTPLTTKLNIGTRELKLTKTDYLDFLTTVNIQGGQTISLNSILKLAPKLTYPLANDIFRVGDILEINGTIPTDGLVSYKIKYGIGENPTNWLTSGIRLNNPSGTPPAVINGKLASWDTSSISQSNIFTIKLTIYKTDKSQTEKYIRNIYLDPSLKKGWPRRINEYNSCESETTGINTNMNYLVSVDKKTIFKAIPKYLKDSTILGPNNEHILVNGNKLTNYNDKYSIISGKELSSRPCGYYWIGILEPLVEDINNDGKKEIVVQSGGNPTKIHIFNEDGTYLNTFSSGFDLPGGNLQTLQIFDFDLDGQKEIIPGMYSPGPLNIYSSFGNLKYSFDRHFIMGAITANLIMTGKLSSSDVDNDGKKDLLLSYLGEEHGIYLDVIHYDSQSGNKISSVSGWPKKISSERCTSNSYYSIDTSEAAVGDINNDSEKDIAILTQELENVGGPEGMECERKVKLIVFDNKGNILSGFPLNVEESMFSGPPIIADINKDGFREIIFGTRGNENGKLYVFNYNGNLLWKKEVQYGFYSTPSVLDSNNDGYLEITIAQGATPFLLHLFDYTGNELVGWPNSMPWNSYRSILSADINGDNQKDIVTTSGGIFSCPYNCGGVLAWNKDGTFIQGFTKVTEVDAQSSATIDDIDKDGKLEIVASSDWDVDTVNMIEKQRGSIYVWELDAPYNPKLIDWPMFMHDAQHTGCYDCGPKSKITNIGTTAISGTLTFTIKKLDGATGNYVVYKILPADKITIPVSGSVDLANLFNFKSLVIQDEGTYKIISEFKSRTSGVVSEAGFVVVNP